MLPGLIDAHSHITTQDEMGGGSDRHERGQRVSTGLRILDSVNPQCGWLRTALEGGVTTLLVTPGSNAPWGGQIVVLTTVPRPTVEEMLLDAEHHHAQTAIEMEYALKVAREFGLVANIEHGFDAWKMLDDIKASGVVITFGPMTYPFANEANYTPGILAKAEVKVALTMDSASDFEKHHLHHVQMAVRYGMDPLDALRAVTIVPAEILRVQHRVGSLEPGKDGDAVILDGDPLSTYSHVLFTIVDGKVAYQRPVAELR